MNGNSYPMLAKIKHSRSARCDVAASSILNIETALAHLRGALSALKFCHL